MAFAYGLTTPIGQAIGLALLFSPGTSYDPASRGALILVGTMNALSAGLLLWASLVELLAAGTSTSRPPLVPTPPHRAFAANCQAPPAHALSGPLPGRALTARYTLPTR